MQLTFSTPRHIKFTSEQAFLPAFADYMRLIAVVLQDACMYRRRDNVHGEMEYVCKWDGSLDGG